MLHRTAGSAGTAGTTAASELRLAHQTIEGLAGRTLRQGSPVEDADIAAAILNARQVYVLGARADATAQRLGEACCDALRNNTRFTFFRSEDKAARPVRASDIIDSLAISHDSAPNYVAEFRSASRPLANLLVTVSDKGAQVFAWPHGEDDAGPRELRVGSAEPALVPLRAPQAWARYATIFGYED